MAPVEVSKLRPAGNVAEIDQEVTAPPLEVGVTADIVTSFVSDNELGVYVMEDGATSLTVMETVVESLPPAFVAVMV